MKALSFCETCKLKLDEYELCTYNRKNMPRSYIATENFLKNGGQLCSRNTWKKQVKKYNVGETWKNEFGKIRRLLPGSNFVKE